MILVSVVAFFIVRQNILASLDANLLQRATAAAQSELVDPERLAGTPTGALGRATSGSPWSTPTGWPSLRAGR